MTTPLMLGALGALVLVIFVLSMTPRSRVKRAVARRKRREMAELRSRVSANARATYDKQFPRGTRLSGARGKASYYGGSGVYADSSGGSDGGSSCDSGGGDSGGGGGDGGGC